MQTTQRNGSSGGAVGWKKTRQSDDATERDSRPRRFKCRITDPEPKWRLRDQGSATSETRFRLGIGTADVGMVAGKPMQRQPSMTRGWRQPSGNFWRKAAGHGHVRFWRR
jgi:hypothetical protein